MGNARREGHAFGRTYQRGIGNGVADGTAVDVGDDLCAKRLDTHQKAIAVKEGQYVWQKFLTLGILGGELGEHCC